VAEPKSVPQRLKPYFKGMVYGTDESVPLSKTRAKQNFAAAYVATVATCAAHCLLPCRFRQAYAQAFDFAVGGFEDFEA